MSVPVSAASRRLCEKSDWSISNLKLQKLLYIAHMLHIGRTNSPLLTSNFEAWDYGPVMPELYHRVKIFGSDPVGNVFRGSVAIPEGSEEASSLDETAEQLGHAEASRLVAITHWDRGAWAKHYYPGQRGVIIPNDDIRQEYLDRTNAAKKRQAASG